MRILFDNLLSSATLSARGTVSVNYPLANLTHPFLVKRFQQIVSGETVYDPEDPWGDGLTDDVTLTWTTDQTIDTIILGYTNCVNFTLKLFSSAGVLLDTQTFTSAEMGKTFSPVSQVRYVKLKMDDGTAVYPMTVYLGGLGIGTSFAMPDPVADWEPGFEDNSFGQSTIDGQVLGQYVEPLKVYSFNFFSESFAEYKAIEALLADAGKLTPLFIAPTEEDMTFIPPLYATVQLSSPRKEGRLFTFSLAIKEAR